jgi:hypothetical protein
MFSSEYFFVYILRIIKYKIKFKLKILRRINKMNKIKVAKELVKLAKQLMADE